MYSSSSSTPTASGAAVTAQVQAANRGWWRHAVTYQVYVRSFQDSDGDGIGDLAGVRARLPYLRGLGVDAIWVSPFYPSPQHDHGCDVADYLGVNPQLGTLACVDALVRDAHRLDIKLLIDIVPNHCSIEHPWFAAAVAAGPGSPERARFHFADGRGECGEVPPNNWCSIFGGPAWRRITEPDGTPGQWYLHTFAPEQADFNWRHPDVGGYFEQVLRFWFDRGVDGVRIDVAHGLHKRDGLPDHAWALQDELTGDPVNPHAWNQPEVHHVWRRWRQIAEQYTQATGRERVLIGEVGVLDAGQLAAYQRPDELHQSFYFDFLRAPWDARQLHDSIERGLATVTASGSPVAWVLNNHDMPRSVTRYAGGAPGADPGDIDLGTARARAAALLMLALPGSTFLYQGEELGLPEVTDLPDHAITDPMFHRTNGVRRGRDGCRVPLPWTTSAGDSFGFSPVGTQRRAMAPTAGLVRQPRRRGPADLRGDHPGALPRGDRAAPPHPRPLIGRVPLATNRARRAGLHPRRHLRVRRQLHVPAGAHARRRAAPAGQRRRGGREDATKQRRLVPAVTGWRQSRRCAKPSRLRVPSPNVAAVQGRPSPTGSAHEGQGSARIPHRYSLSLVCARGQPES